MFTLPPVAAPTLATACGVAVVEGRVGAVLLWASDVEERLPQLQLLKLGHDQPLAAGPDLHPPAAASERQKLVTQTAVHRESETHMASDPSQVPGEIAGEIPFDWQRLVECDRQRGAAMNRLVLLSARSIGKFQPIRKVCPPITGGRGRKACPERAGGGGAGW